MFEAGAIASSHPKPRICAILFDLKPLDVVGPLVHFQATEYSKDEIYQGLKTINANAEKDRHLPSNILESAFQMWWPELEKRIGTILNAPRGGPAEKKRDDRSLLEEIVGVVRGLQMDHKDLQDSIDLLGRLINNPFTLTPQAAAVVEALQQKGPMGGVAAAVAPSQGGIPLPPADYRPRHGER